MLYAELIGEVEPLEGARGLIEDLTGRGHAVVLASSAKVATSGKAISTSSARTRGAVNSQLHHAPLGARLNSK